MTRSGTTIWHEILTSESVSKMEAKTKIIFIGLLMTCDDWGRFPDNPHKLAMQMPALGITPDDIRAAIDWLDGECIARYTAQQPDGDRTVTVCQLLNWEEYQWRLKSRDNAKYPSKEGKLEATTNPLATSRGDRTVTVPPPNEMNMNEVKVNKSNKIPPTGGEYVRVWIDLYRELRVEPEYKPTGREIGELKKIWNHLDGKMDDFRRVCANYLESEFVKVPSAKKLYESGIEGYRHSHKEVIKPHHEYGT